MLALLLFLILPGFFVVIGIAKYMAAANSDSAVNGLVLAFVASLVIFIFGILPTGFAWSNQVRDSNALSQHAQNTQIYTAKRDQIVSQIKDALTVTYPNLEKEIFGDIAGKGGALVKTNPTFMFTAYPQLQSSKTILAYAHQIEVLNASIYDEQLVITKTLADMHTRSQNPWYIHWWIPAAPTSYSVNVPATEVTVPATTVPITP